MKWTRHLPLFGMALLFGPFLCAPSMATAQSFDLSKAVVAGSFCPLGTSQLKIDGNKLIVEFSNSTLSILAGEPALTGLAACKVVLPLSVPRGQFISRVTHRVRANVSKSANVEAKIAVATGYNTTAPVLGEGTFPAGTSHSGDFLLYKTYETALLPAWISDMCSAGRVADGVLSTTLAASAVRANLSESVEFDLNGREHGLEIWIELAKCP